MVLTLLPVPAKALPSAAQWGIASEDGGAPDEWIGSGSFTEAVNYAMELSSGVAYIQLSAAEVVTDKIAFEEGTIILDLNGKKIRGTNNTGIIDLNGGTLTIADTSQDKLGIITTGAGSGSNKGSVNVNGGNLLVKGGTIQNTYSSYNTHAISISSGNLTIESGKVDRGNGSGYAIYNTGGTVDINGGEVTGSGKNARAIYNNDKLNIYNGEIYSTLNTIYNKGAITMTGGTVRCTTESGNYIGIENQGSVNISGGEVRAVCGIYCSGYYANSVTISGDSKIIGGQGGYIASAIYSETNTSINVTGGELSGYTTIDIREDKLANVSITGGKLSGTYAVISVAGLPTGHISVTGGRLEGTRGGIHHVGKGSVTIGGTAVINSETNSATWGTVYVLIALFR